MIRKRGDKLKSKFKIHPNSWVARLHLQGTLDKLVPATSLCGESFPFARVLRHFVTDRDDIALVNKGKVLCVSTRDIVMA